MPTGSAGKPNAPSAAVVSVLVKPVSLLRTVTLDCGTEAPVASTTTPPRFAVVNCATTGAVENRTTSDITASEKRNFIRTPPHVDGRERDPRPGWPQYTPARLGCSQDSGSGRVVCGG